MPALRDRLPFCDGLRRQGPEGARCQRPAGWGTSHPGYGRCKFHGGSSPSGRVAGERAMAEGEARKVVASLGGRLDIGAAEALELVWQGAAADVKAASSMVEGMSAEQLASPQGQALTRILDAARETTRRAGKAALDAKVDERRVRVSEATTARLVAAVVGALEDCSDVLPPEALPAVRAAIARRLRPLASAGAIAA